MTIDTLSPSSATVPIQDAVVTVGRWLTGLFASILLLGTMSTAVGQETFTFDNQGYNDGQIIGAPITITEGSFTLSFEDVNTSVPDFEYRSARGGDLNYNASGQLLITRDGGAEFNAQSIDLGYNDDTTVDGGPPITGAEFQITGYRNGTQVAQINVTYSSPTGGENNTFGLSSQDAGFTNVDEIEVDPVSISGGEGINDEFNTFDNVVVSSATSPQPDIAVEDSDGTSIPDGDTSPSSGESTDFGSVAVGSNTAETYTIRNTGTNTLNISSITSSNTGDFTVSSVPSSVASSGSATFDVTFAPSAGGTRSATITINSDDPDAEGTYTFSVEGDGLVPDIAVEDDGNNPLPDGSGTFDYGTVDVGSTSQRFFSIQNTGGADLSLSGLPAVELSGTHAWDFSVSATPSSPVSAGGQTSFAITFDPQASGTRTATVTISNNDPDEDPYTFEVTGTGNNPNAAPTFTAGSSVSLTVDEDAGPTSLSSQLQVDDPDGGQTLEWTVSAAPSNGTLSGFSTTAATGSGVQPSNVTYEPSADFSGSDAFDVQVSDGTATDVITVNVTVDNLAPVFNSSNSAAVAENSSGTVLNVNADNGGDGANDSGVNYALSGGADQAGFSIDTNTGELALDVTPDYENPSDSDTNNDYVVEITADDGEAGNNTSTQTITVSVTDENEAPTATTDAATSVSTTSATLNGTAGTNGGPSTTVQFEYFVTADGAGSATTVTADQSPVTSAAGASVSAGVSGLQPGTQYTVRTLASSDEGSDQGSDQTFTTTGVPEADLFDSSDNEIADGGTFDFGSVTVGNTSAETFTLQNNGSAPLSVTPPSSLPGDFSITNTGGATPPLDPGESLTFTVEFAPSSIGTVSEPISAGTNDPDEDPYNVTLEGTGANNAPTISSIADQEIEEDATLGPLGFTVSDTESSAANLTVTASSDNTTLVPNSNITLSGKTDGDASTRTIEVSPAANESGSATITVTVDDGSGTNNTASESFTLTVNAVPDLAITDGSASGLDFTAEVSPGTDNNAVGIFKLSADQSGVTFDAVTVTNNSPGVSGITNARLYLSADQTLAPGEDQQVAAFDVTDGSAEGAFTFTGIGATIPAGGYYAILAIDVASGASASGIQFSLDQTSDLSVTGGEIATVNGTSQSTFSALPLSNGTTALPVELARFEATTSETEAVSLQWETISETDNAGFEIQRVKASRRDASTSSDGWQTVGSVNGAGTTTEAQSYRFADTNVPYDADSLTYRLKQIDTDGTASYSEPITVARSPIQQVQLLGTYPNPARQQATVRFAIPDGSDDGVTLRLYDTLGRQVRTVQASAQAGRHKIQLETGRLSSGVYFLRLQAGTIVKTQRLTVVR